jgi:tRNA A-37 threonylcarbamoyl transferase component Bud32
MTDLIGTRLNQYELTEIVRRGSMSTVYKAYQASLDRFVAVKVLHSNRDPQFAARFKREARAIATLQHHNILPIYDYGEDDGWLFLVMQYVENGTTLADLLSSPMPESTALRLTSQVLDALAYAHARGIIHRDIKPANILMPSPTWPMLADFGIAKLMNDNQHLTMTGSIIGTAVYMAPEQATGQPIDARTDLYAAGVVLYQLLTGRPPFDGDTPMAVLTKHVYEPPPPPRRINPDLPLEAEAVLLRALAKDPAQRYQSAAEMAADIERVANRIDRDPKRVQMTGMYLAGVQAIETGRWEDAIDQLSKLVARDPEYEDAGELLEAARAEQERLKAEARQQAEQARGQRASAPPEPAPPVQPAERPASQQTNKGGEVGAAAATAAPAQGTCRRCGRVVRATAKWCPSCGAPLPVISTNTTVSTAPVRPSPPAPAPTPPTPDRDPVAVVAPPAAPADAPTQVIKAGEEPPKTVVAPVAPTETPGRGGSTTWAIVIAAVVVLLLIGGLVFVLGQR